MIAYLRLLFTLPVRIFAEYSHLIILVDYMTDTPEVSPKVEADRQLLADAQSRGTGPTLAAYLRLSGPGWLQSAITLGGGSLAGALFLGSLGGYSMLWLQLVAIAMGVIMLSAISYVTLSTGERPFQAINSHINPALGWGWLFATVLANIIWCMPQFGLCFAALQKNLSPVAVDDSMGTKFIVSGVILAAAGFAVLMNVRQGLVAKIFDWFLKALIAMIVICFFGVVLYLTILGKLPWGEILAGFIPDLTLWNRPGGDMPKLLTTLPEDVSGFWSNLITSEQRSRMIASAATAVGINMTFLLPYSMLARGWDKTFRGLARFDLSTGMAIPYVLVTSCVMIATAFTFHAKVDESDSFFGSDPVAITSSVVYGKTRGMLTSRLAARPEAEQKKANDAAALKAEEVLAALKAEEVAALEATMQGKDKSKEITKAVMLDELAFSVQVTSLPSEEKRIAASLMQRDAFQLSKALSPLLGESAANWIFGLGVFGMGFSTIIILMLINGYAFCEAAGKPKDPIVFAIGCLVAGVAGATWPFFWSGDAKLYLSIVASTFGVILLPIAYITFMLMMNSKTLLGNNRPTGVSMIIWNVLMGVSVAGALVAAGTSLFDKATKKSATEGVMVVTMAVVYVLIVIVFFFVKLGKKPAERDIDNEETIAND